MATRDLDDLEARVDALTERLERQGKLIERITTNVYDVVEAMREMRDLRWEVGGVPEEPAEPQPLPSSDGRVVDLVDYVRNRASGDA